MRSAIKRIYSGQVGNKAKLKHRSCTTAAHPHSVKYDRGLFPHGRDDVERRDLMVPGIIQMLDVVLSFLVGQMAQTDDVHQSADE